jgi:hypothetical protein
MQPAESNNQNPSNPPVSPVPENSQPPLSNSNEQGGQVINPTPAQTPPASLGQVASGSMLADQSKKTKRPKKLRVVAIVAICLLVLGGGAGAYFGYYLPNQPENLWRAALTNTGKGYDKISGYINSAKYDKGTKVDGSFKFNTSGLAADGNISGVSDDKNNSKYTGSISASGLKVNFDLRTIASSTSTPDLYFKVDGLQGLGSLLGLDVYGPGLSKSIDGINGQWYLVDHTLLDQYTGQSTSATQSITKKDVNDFLTALNGPTKKYIFTSDQNNMAIVAERQIGREKQDGLNTYHYKVGLNKNNLKKWNKETCDNLKNNKLYKMLNFNIDQAALEKQCYDTTDIDSIDSSKTADAWVDTHTKLVHKVRFSTSKNANNYIDVLQNYAGGSKIPFAIAFSSDSSGEKTSGTINITYDSKTTIVKIAGDVTTKGSTNGSGNFSLTVSPNSSAVNVDKPAGTKNILQLINDLGLSSLLSPQSSVPEPQLQ